MSAAIGLGCRAGASVEAILARVDEAKTRGGFGAATLHAPAKLRAHPALCEAAERLGWPLVWHEEAALRAVAARVTTHSPRVEALFGVGSVAEAAALAGAGQGAELVTPKFSGDGVSCAVARGPA